MSQEALTDADGEVRELTLADTLLLGPASEVIPHILAKAASSDFQILPLAERHFGELREVLDAVAAEKRFLAFTQAPPLEECLAFYQGILDNDSVAFVALAGGKVCGWCDILPTHGEARAHVGTLGIGLAHAARHRGIGLPLIQATVAAALVKGFTRIELTVRIDNLNAKALYERVGFVTESLARQYFRVDGKYHDAYAMALLSPQPELA